MDRFGRKFTFQLGASICLVGGSMQAAAQNLPMILVGRILAGWAVGLMSMAVPIYQAEFAHPRSRGLIVGLAQQMIGIGFIVSTYVSLAWVAKETKNNATRSTDAASGQVKRLRIPACTGYQPIPVAILASFPSRASVCTRNRHGISARVAAPSHRERAIRGGIACPPEIALRRDEQRLDRGQVHRDL